MYIASITINEDWMDLEEAVAEVVDSFEFAADSTYLIQVDAGRARLAELADGSDLEEKDGMILNAGYTAVYQPVQGLKIFVRKDEPTLSKARLVISKREA
jgi:hypothetical protein